MIYNDYRPHRFDDVKGQTFVVENIRNQSKKDRFFPVFILCGQYGSGKTTMARLIAMAANCTHKDENGNPCGECDACKAVLNHAPEGIIEIDGASNNGVEDIRRLLANAGMLGMYNKKVIVIDEAHMLSKSAFNALLITLENPPSHCIFILCTTEKDALPETVISRAPVYTFGKIADSVVREHVLEVAGKSGILISKDAAGLIARYANGAMRNALQILEHLSLQKEDGEEITDQDVISILGISSIEQRADFLDACIRADIGKVNGILKACENAGVSLTTFLSDTLSMATDLLLYLAKSEVVGSTYYMESLKRLSVYGEMAAGKLCRLFSRLTSRGNRSLTSEQVVIEVMAAFRAIKEEEKNVVYVAAPVVHGEAVKPSLEVKTTEEPEIPAEQPQEALEESETEKNADTEESDKSMAESSGFDDAEDTAIPFEEEPEEKTEEKQGENVIFQFGSPFGGFAFPGMVSVGTPKPKKKKVNVPDGDSSMDLMADGNPVCAGKTQKMQEEENLEAGSGQMSLRAFEESEGEEPVEEYSEEAVMESQNDVPEAPETDACHLDEEQEINDPKIGEDASWSPQEPYEQEPYIDDAAAYDDIPEDGELSWEEMAELGLVTDTPDVPVPETKKELDLEYGKASSKNLTVLDMNQIADANDPEEPIEEDEDDEEENPMFRTRADLMRANRELKKLLENPGFSLCYKKAVVVNKDNSIYLVYKERRYQIASNAFTMLKKGIHSVMEGDM